MISSTPTTIDPPPILPLPSLRYRRYRCPRHMRPPDRPRPSPSGQCWGRSDSCHMRHPSDPSVPRPSPLGQD